MRLHRKQNNKYREQLPERENCYYAERPPKGTRGSLSRDGWALGCVQISGYGLGRYMTDVLGDLHRLRAKWIWGEIDLFGGERGPYCHGK